MGIRLCILNEQILFTVVTINHKIYSHIMTFPLKLFILLNFRIVIRGSKTNLFPEHLVFLILHDIEEDHLRHYPISETE